MKTISLNNIEQDFLENEGKSTLVETLEHEEQKREAFLGQLTYVLTTALNKLK